MKKYIILSIIVLAFTSSCSEDLDSILETTPVDALTPEQAFATEENLRMYINSLYELSSIIPTSRNILGYPNSNAEMMYLSDNGGDLTYTGQFVEQYYVPGAFTPDDVIHWTWDELRRINYFLDNYEQSAAPEDVKNHYAGIARWFRAKFYFDKVKRFGDVPWYGSVVGSQDEALYKPRDPRTVVMDSVLADINFAIDNINVQKDNTSTTITKSVALGLKSRICLFEGTFRKYHARLGLPDADAWLEDAVDAATQLMESGQYSIHSTGNPENDYHSLFISNDAVSAEVMLVNAADDELGVYNIANYHYSNSGGQYMSSLRKRFVNTYLNIDGSRFTDIPNFETIFFTNEVQGRDLRLSQTIRTPSYERLDGSTPAPYAGVAPTLYHPIKYTHPDPSFDSGFENVNDIPLMRYAEVLLNYAEAKAELGTFTDEDWNNTIGLLRTRAGIADASMPETLDPYMKSEFYQDVNSIAIMEIRRERAVELILEGFRYDDLLRWKAADNLEEQTDGIYVPEMNRIYDLNADGNPDISFVATAPTDPASGVYYMVIDGTSIRLSEGDHGRIILKPELEKEFPDFKYFMPIPFEQLIINPNLEQNEGWPG